MSLHILGSPVVVGLALIGSAAALAQNQPTLVIDDVTVLETDGETHATFTVSLAGPHGSVRVRFLTFGGTATEGTSCGTGGDFVGIHEEPRIPSAVVTELRFAATQNTKQINVTVCGDTRDEPDETFFVYLFFPTGAVIQDDRGQATIRDDDPPPSPWKGLAVSGTIVLAEEQRWQTPTVPAGDYQFELSGMSSDADLYVRIGSPPTTQNFSCRPAKNGASNETCLMSLAQPNVIHVMVRGYAPVTSFALVGGKR